MKKYNSIDDVIVPEVDAKLPEEVKKEKHYNPFYLPLTNLGLIAALLFTGCVVAPRASAQDTKQSYGTEQTVKQDVDLSQYTKVAEQDGLEVYVSATSLKPRHDINKKTNPDWKKSNCVRFLDIILNNTNNFGYTILELEGVVYSPDGTHTKHKLDGEILKKAWGTNYIKPHGILYEPDRWVSEFDCNFPVKQVDKYKLKRDDGNIFFLNVCVQIK